MEATAAAMRATAPDVATGRRDALVDAVLAVALLHFAGALDTGPPTSG
jgi:hypothetical protein